MNTVRKDQTSEKKKKLQPTFSRKIPPDTPKYTRKVELHSTKLFLIALFPLASGDVTVAPPSSFSEFIYPWIAPETDFVPAAGNFTDNFARRSVYRTYIIILSLHQLWFDLHTTEVWTFQSPTPTCFANSAVVYFWLFPLLRETVISRFFLSHPLVVCIPYLNTQCVFHTPRTILNARFLRLLEISFEMYLYVDCVFIALLPCTVLYSENKNHNSISFWVFAYELIEVASTKKLCKNTHLRFFSSALGQLRFSFFWSCKEDAMNTSSFQDLQTHGGESNLWANKQTERERRGSFEDRGKEIL